MYFHFLVALTSALRHCPQVGSQREEYLNVHPVLHITQLETGWSPGHRTHTQLCTVHSLDYRPTARLHRVSNAKRGVRLFVNSPFLSNNLSCIPHSWWKFFWIGCSILLWVLMLPCYDEHIVCFFLLCGTSVRVCVYSHSHIKTLQWAHLNASAARWLIPVVDWPS